MDYKNINRTFSADNMVKKVRRESKIGSNLESFNKVRSPIKPRSCVVGPVFFRKYNFSDFSTFFFRIESATFE